MASILEVLGTKKWFRIRGINSVSNMYANGIHVKNAWKVFKHDLTKEGVIP